MKSPTCATRTYIVLPLHSQTSPRSVTSADRSGCTDHFGQGNELRRWIHNFPKVLPLKKGCYHGAMRSHPSELAGKAVLLRQELRSLGRLLVAYSGGVDSAYLAWAAHRELKDKMLAVIADSPSLARIQFDDAVSFAGEQGIPLEVVSTEEMERPEYV